MHYRPNSTLFFIFTRAHKHRRAHARGPISPPAVSVRSISLVIRWYARTAPPAVCQFQHVLLPQRCCCCRELAGTAAGIPLSECESILAAAKKSSTDSRKEQRLSSSARASNSTSALTQITDRHDDAWHVGLLKLRALNGELASLV